MIIQLLICFLTDIVLEKIITYTPWLLDVSYVEGAFSLEDAFKNNVVS